MVSSIINGLTPRPLDRTLIGTTTLDYRRSGNNANKGALHISQNSKTGDSPSDNLMSILRTLVGRGGSYSSVELQSIYSTTSTNRAVPLLLTTMCFTPWNTPSLGCSSLKKFKEKPKISRICQIASGIDVIH